MIRGLVTLCSEQLRWRLVTSTRSELARRIIRAFDPGHEGESILLVRGFRATAANSTPSVTVLSI